VDGKTEDPTDRQTINAITFGRAEAELIERRIQRGTATPEDLLKRAGRIRVAFDRLAETCLHRTRHSSKS
jgi:hypothetical protein